MILLNLLGVSCLTEVLNRSNMYLSSAFVMSDQNTVHYIQSKVQKLNKGQIDPDAEVNTKSSIYIYKDRLYDSSNLIYKDEKTQKENTFFFTAPSQGKYFIVLQIDNPDNQEIGVETFIYSGEAKRPAIISNNDVEVSKAEGLIKNLLEYVKNTIAMQNMDYDDDQEYKEIYSGILKRAFLLIGLKMLTTFFTLFYSKTQTKKFFESQGLGAKN